MLLIFWEDNAKREHPAQDDCSGHTRLEPLCSGWGLTSTEEFTLILHSQQLFLNFPIQKHNAEVNQLKEKIGEWMQ